MDSETPKSRLSRISTSWTTLAHAHGGVEPQARAARLAFIQRYGRAAYRYLLGAVRDTDTADDLLQEFALRFMRGDFRRADPERGRFRDYLKTTLYHLVVDHFKQKRKRPLPLDTAVAEPAGEAWGPAEAEEQFIHSWREELLARAWSALGAEERQSGHPHFTVLTFRTENPKATSAEMARQLTDTLRPKRPFTETGVRKMLQRARAKFADFLIEDVAYSLGDCSTDELEQELIELGLLAYCRSALGRRKH